MALAHQSFQAGDQGVLVGAVQRIARLEGDDTLPALVAEQCPRLARRQDELPVFGMFRLRQNAHRAAEQMRARIAL